MNCTCGCGEQIPEKHLHRYRPPYVLRGHRPPLPDCACGCGEAVTWTPNSRYQHVRFIRGHNQRGREKSAAELTKLSTALKGRVSNRLGAVLSAETRAKIAAAQVGRKPTFTGAHSAETRAAIRASLKARTTVLTYYSAHARVRRERGKPDHCEHCGLAEAGRRYEWAYTGPGREAVKAFSANLNDYISLCVACHRKFDGYRGRPVKGSKWSEARRLAHRSKSRAR